MGPVIIALCAFVGGIASALLGWAESKEAFNSRKFLGSAARSFIAGAVFATGYQLSGTSLEAMDILAAILAGAGVDGLGKRLGATVRGAK
ncbi:MAG: hypothetical protein M0R06_08135 [Sphaerochaeta sp.]|jgi:hypothetical protein|nr:hypothetical protein [Sphaerochaeta sp.]